MSKTSTAQQSAGDGDVYSRLLAVKIPTLEDLKDLCRLEASGQQMYQQMCAVAPNEAVKSLLARNGQEEMAHAHHVRRVIALLFGERFPVPSAADTEPYPAPPVSRDGLKGLADAEFAGEGFYVGWAAVIGNEAAAKLLRQNGTEEARHGRRLLEAIDQLPH